MPAIETEGGLCTAFWKGLLAVGNELVVFASRPYLSAGIEELLPYDRKPRSPAEQKTSALLVEGTSRNDSIRSADRAPGLSAEAGQGLPPFPAPFAGLKRSFLRSGFALDESDHFSQNQRTSVASVRRLSGMIPE
jgi:hypothetical protein